MRLAFQLDSTRVNRRCRKAATDSTAPFIKTDSIDHEPVHDILTERPLCSNRVVLGAERNQCR